MPEFEIGHELFTGYLISKGYCSIGAFVVHLRSYRSGQANSF